MTSTGKQFAGENGSAGKRIAIISTMLGSPWGGSEVLYARTVEAALEARHDVLISTHQWPSVPAPLQRLKQLGAEINLRSRRFPQYCRLLNMLRLQKITRRLNHYRRVGQFQPDVMLINEGAAYDSLHRPSLMKFVRESRVPYFVIVHYMDDFWIPPTWAEKQLAARYYADARQVIFVSQRNHRDCERHLATRFNNAVVLRNPVNLQTLTAEPWPSQETLTLAHVGRLHVKTKGQDILLEVLSQPAWRARDWELNLYGEGPDREYLEYLAAHFQIQDRVRFHGQVSDIRQIWAENQLLVMPSRGEGTPLALVEAMLCGRPAVLSDIGGHREWVTEGVQGFIAEAPTTNSYGAALERAWRQRNSLGEMGLAARDVALRQIDPTPEQTLLDTLLAATQPTAQPALRAAA